jgi:hypothetical protein
MRWGNVWAFAGLLLLALPVLVHLLARRTAKLQRFPTLRFLGTARLLPRRSPRLTDPLLLVLRLGILAAAITALARPNLLSRVSTRGSATLTRVLVVDTSASMQRLTPAGERAIAAARRVAQQLARDGGNSTTIETATPATTLRGAVAWLNTKATRRELVVVSDFQLGTIDSLLLAGIPRDIGLGFLPVALQPEKGISDFVTLEQGSEAVARITSDGARTEIDWVRRPAAGQYRPAVKLLAGSAERASVAAALDAALTLGQSAQQDTTHNVTIVYPAYEGRLELIRAARALSQPWMADVFARVHDDSLLVRAAADAEVLSLPASYDTAYTVVARNTVGRPAVLAAAAQDRLLLLPLVDAGSLTSAALIAAAERALSSSAPATELEPATLPADLLQRWRRAPGEPRLAPGHNSNEHSDGRWFWLLAITLLILENVVRRRPERARTSQTQTTPKAKPSERAA